MIRRMRKYVIYMKSCRAGTRLVNENQRDAEFRCKNGGGRPYDVVSSCPSDVQQPDLLLGGSCPVWNWCWEMPPVLWEMRECM